MNRRSSTASGPALKQGLYDPRFEHDTCGVGFVVDVKGRKSHRILEQAIQVLRNLDHRGACGCEANIGDGAGVLLQMPHAFFEAVGYEAHLRQPLPARPVRRRHRVSAAPPDARAVSRSISRASSTPRGRASSAGGRCQRTTLLLA